MDGQLAETIAQEKLITTQDGCRIKVIQVAKKPYVEIWPESLARQTGMDIDKRSLTLTIQHQKFPETSASVTEGVAKLRFAEDIAKKFPLWRNPENK